MLIIGITGSIAMGKSTVASMLSKLNIPIHDADKTVHQLFRKNGGAYNSIAKIFLKLLVKMVSIELDWVERFSATQID